MNSRSLTSKVSSVLVTGIVLEEAKKFQSTFDDEMGQHKGRPIAEVRTRLRAEVGGTGCTFSECDLDDYAKATSDGNLDDGKARVA